MNLLNVLESYFGKDGILENCSFEVLNGMASKAYRRYMCSRAYEECLGDAPRSEQIHGPPADAYEDIESENGTFTRLSSASTVY